MYRLVLLFAGVFCARSFFAQIKTPFIFREFEKRAALNIHRYLRYDTIIETSGAKIHIHYSKKTNKPYLLLLHGMGANARTNWYKQIGQLSEQFNLLAPDLIYFGESNSKENNFSAEFQAMQIHEVLKALNIRDNINVMGFSYGGLVAAVYNQLYYSEVNKLIIIDGPVKFFSGHTADSLAIVAGASDINNLIVPQTIKDFNAMQKAVMSKKMFISRNLKRKIITHFFTPSRSSRQQLIGYLISHQGIYQNYDYQIADTPTLLIWGGKDGVVPLSVGISLNKYFPETTRLIIFKKAKHDVHFRDSKKVNEAVINFLRK